MRKRGQSWWWNGGVRTSVAAARERNIVEKNKNQNFLEKNQKIVFTNRTPPKPGGANKKTKPAAPLFI